MIIGVLSLQGAFLEHIQMLDRLGIKAVEIRSMDDLCNKELCGIILPGGESTVMGRLLAELNMMQKLKELIKNGLPIFGTCAGMILMAGHIENDSVKHIACMDITVKRNAYGRQLGSFHTQAMFDSKKIPMTFIRAPYIVSAGKDVEVLSTVDHNIVAARQRNMLVTAFHPEITDSSYVHEYFINMIKNR